MPKVIEERQLVKADYLPRRVYIFCPACAEALGNQGLHCLDIDNVHKFNGNYDKPTFTPSLGHFKNERGYFCHSYITDGKMQYQGDCQHGRAGQTMELLDVPTEFVERAANRDYYQGAPKAT